MTGFSGTNARRTIKAKVEYIAVIGSNLGHFVAELLSETEGLANQRSYHLGLTCPPVSI